MSQFNTPEEPNMYAYGDPMAEPPRTSGIAIASLVLSLLGIIPCLGLLTAPIGALLGLIGAITISPPKKGKVLAISGLIIGVICFSVQGFGAYYAAQTVKGAMSFVTEGPSSALDEGFAGNYGAFKGKFIGAGATQSDEEVKTFIDELQSRYGTFISSQLDQSGNANAQPPIGQPSFPMSYVLTFNDGSVSASVELVFADVTGQQPGMLKKFGYIMIQDSDLGDLQYPPDDSGSSTETDASETPSQDEAPNEEGDGTDGSSDPS
ncbi:MAG: DUF4190 domain-containing protein [Planctomycetota bacterium]|nr:DUF4190 domain-containing protein [Planctomycetota bacterium]